MAKEPLEDTLRLFLDGAITREEAVRRLLPVTVEFPALAVSGELTSAQNASLMELGRELTWEFLKRQPGSTAPQVPYGSPEYHAYLASTPFISPDGPEPRGTA